MRTRPAKPLYRLGSVVQAVPVTRAVTIVFALTALTAFAVTLVLAKDRVQAVVGSLVIAVLWSGVMIGAARSKPAPSPLPVSPEDLPREAATWSAVLPAALLYAALAAGTAAYSLWMRQYFVLGIALSVPAMSAAGLRQLERTQREAHGVLWTAAGMTWTVYGRVRYLTPDPGPEEDGSAPLAA